jgi:hypothetical protein
VAKKGSEKRWHFSHLNVRPGESIQIREALHGLSPRAPPPTPHHWAEPLTRQGVAPADLLELLEGLGLIKAPWN